MEPHENEDITVEEFFQQSFDPAGNANLSIRLKEFLDANNANKRPLVLITSGGTTVPLEKNTVRFIDNFSAGTRGSASAEQFLEKGYGVIFFHRARSLEPYNRHFTVSGLSFLDFFAVKDGKADLSVDQAKNVQSWALKYHQFVESKQLLKVSFVTVKDYLFLLKEISTTLSKSNPHALYYLAAAVSDFFIPDTKMAQHKIQSGDGALNLSLDKVPKMIYPLVKEWAPEAYVVSFKLETDKSLLISKSKASLTKYGHQLVIANMLNTRKHHVVFVTPTTEEDINLSAEAQKKDVEIEEQMIPKLIELHSAFLRKKEPASGEEGGQKLKKQKTKE